MILTIKPFNRIYLIVPIENRNSINEIKEYCLSNFKGYNEEYISTVCLNCGSSVSHPNSNEIELVDECSDCFSIRQRFPEFVL